jgi:glycerophosphoryl diester phosphodiesterase
VRPVLAAIAICLALASPAAAAVEIHAHRGGPIEAGVPVSPEDAQPAFDRSHSIGADWMELDAKLSSDGVPFVIHDAGLDRTTDCTGNIGEKTAAQLAGCHVDVLGTEANIKQVPGATVPLPKLADFLAWARAGRVRFNLEIKNQPGDPDFDPGSGFATKVLDAVTAANIPRDHILIQSFWPPNLDVAEAAGYSTSFLTLANASNGSIEYAQSRGYEVLSPAWPIPNAADYVKRAHAAGKKVVPYTFNEEDEVAAAIDAGVDAVIANDVLVAQDVIYGADCLEARAREASLRAALAKARAQRSRSRGAARAKANARVKSVNRERQTAKRLRLKVCTPGP